MAQHHHDCAAHASCHAPAEEVEQLVASCIEQLRARGWRRSQGLTSLLRHLAAHHHPATLAELNQAEGLADLDQATVYRLVMKLEEAGLARRLGLHERATYFQLVVPGHHHDYLVCTQCGKIEDVGLSCPAEELERQVMKKTGYRQVYHQLEFYGICPDCAAQA